jgi:hypothetical protein
MCWFSDTLHPRLDNLLYGTVAVGIELEMVLDPLDLDHKDLGERIH